MTVPVSVGGKGPFDFIVDTGAERSVLSRELALALELEPGARARLFDFTGASPVNTVKVPSLSAGKLSTAAMEAPSLAMANIGAQGMLGIDALQGHKVVIDFGRNRMSVVPAKRHALGEIVVRAEARLGQLIVTKARFNGEPIAVIIDTGSWVSVGNSAMRALAKKAPRLLGPITVRSVTGRTFAADYVSVSDLNVGGVRFDNVGLAFADVPPFVRFGLRDKPALILGMSSLRLFRRVEIDFVNREIGFSLPAPPINFLDVCRGDAVCRKY
jgi:predicted aspartyl protease